MLRTWSSALLIAASATLLILNVSGSVSAPTFDESTEATNGVLVAGYHYAPRGDRAELQNMLEKQLPKFDLELINDVVFESLVHSDNRRIQLHENWFMWITGLFYEPAGRTQSAQRIVSGGHAICSEAAAVVNEISKINGVQARLIALNGHVVSEVLTEQGWQIADPDYGVVYANGFEVLQAGGMATIMAEKLNQKGYGEATIAGYIGHFETTEDNRALSIGAASSPRLHVFERLSEWLKWIIPGALFVVGAGGLRGYTYNRMRN